MGDYEQDHHTGVFASLRRVCDTALATVYNRVELVAVEMQEEKERLIRIFIVAANVALSSRTKSRAISFADAGAFTAADSAFIAGTI